MVESVPVAVVTLGAAIESIASSRSAVGVALAQSSSGDARDAAGTPAAGDMERVLVVDDEAAQQLLSQVQLQKLGYGVTVTSSGEDAVALLAAAKQAQQHSLVRKV